MEHLEVVKNSNKLVRAFRVELEFKRWFLEREENRSTQRKSSRQGRETTTNLPFHIPEAWKRSKPPHKGHYREYPLTPPPPGRRKASALITAPLLLSFRQKPIYLLYLFSLLYLHKKVSSFMSISLLINHNNYFKSLYLFISWFN